MLRKRVLSVLLSVVMLGSLLVPAFAADSFPDVQGHWSAASVERWSKAGVFKGDDEGNFNPDSEMTRAEFATALDNLMGYAEKAKNTYSDVKDDAWYADAILRLTAAEVMQGSGSNALPDVKISREEAVVMLCRAFGLKPSADAKITFNDADSISSWAKDSVAALVEREMINGVGGNTFAPDWKIDRASVAKLLDNMIGQLVTERGATLSGEQKGITVVAADGVTLKDASAAGNIVVAPKAAGVTLTLTGTTQAGTIIVKAQDVTIVVDKGAKVDEIAASVAVEVDGEGTVGKVTAPVNKAEAPLGTYTGRVISSNLVKYANIPYATYERWQRPVQATSASAEDLDARDETTVITNQNGNGQEGLLTMDIYVNPTSGRTDKGVLVWNTCGGGTGSNSNSFDPSVIVRENPDVIVAVVNIRVGYYGCINLQAFSDYDSYTVNGKNPYDASNNLMRLDYLESLKWVQANIASFGGDPHNVTIGGQSAGAANASAMLLIEEAHDYFQKVILESGVAIDRISVAPLSESEFAAGRFQQYARGTMDGRTPVAAAEKDYVTTIKEGLTLEPGSFATAQSGLSVGGVGAYPKGCQGKTFTNVADGVVIPVTVEERWAAINKAAEKGIQILVGSTEGEYDRDLAGKDAQGAKADIMASNWGKLAANDPATGEPTVNGKETSAEAEALFQGYVTRGQQAGTEYERDEVTAYKDFKNDINQKVSAVMIAEAFANQGSSAYLFSFEWYAPNESGNRATHGSEKSALYPGQWNGPEDLGKAMRKAWASFIIEGDPNADNSYFDAANVQWKPYSKAEPNTMVFDEKMECVKGQRVEDVESLMPLFEEFPLLRG